MSNEHRMEELGLRIGEDYTFGRGDTLLIEAALADYGNYFRQAAAVLRHKHGDDSLETLACYRKYQEIKKVHDIVGACFEVVARGVGEGGA